MFTVFDDFNVDAGWVKTGSWVDSTKSVSAGVLTLTAGAGGAGSSAWKKDGLVGRNVSITVRAGASVVGTPQIHLRETDASNYLVAYIDPNDGTLNIGKVVAGVYTSFASVAISAFNSASTYTFTAKVFNNILFASYLRTQSDGDVGAIIEKIHADVSGFTGTTHGIGVTSGTQKYDWVDMRILEGLTNVVCVGDSNVGADNRLYWPNQMQKRRFREGFIARNQGTGGYSTQDIYDERATRIDPFVVSGAKNIVSIATGNNDYAVESKTPSQAYDVQKTLIAYCQGLGYKCELATLIPFPYADRAGQTSLQFVDGLNTLIRGGPATYGYTLCEIHTAFGATNGQLGVVPTTLVNGDEIHYTTASGHPLAARTHLYTLARNERAPIS